MTRKHTQTEREAIKQDLHNLWNDMSGNGMLFDEKVGKIADYVLQQVAEGRQEATEHALRIIHSEEGRIRQVANTVFYLFEELAEYKGEKPIPLEEFGSYKERLRELASLAPSKEGEE